MVEYYRRREDERNQVARVANVGACADPRLLNAAGVREGVWEGYIWRINSTQ
jgi:hypothetical protein